MLKRVFPERQHKTGTNRSIQKVSGGGSPPEGNALSPKLTQRSSDLTDGSVGASSSQQTSSSTSSSPLKSSSHGQHTRLSSLSSNSPVKSEVVGSGGSGGVSNLAKNNISRSCSSTEFQSLKLESMSTIEDFKSVSKTISSALDREILAKQGASGISNELQESTSLSTPSDEEPDPAESLFKHQAKFFCQMKEYLLSQQSSLRQHLEILNATVALRKKRMTSRRQQRFHNTGHSVHLAAKQKPEVTPEIRGNTHDLDLMNEFHSCSSTEKSDEDIQVCPLCGVEIEDSENPTALEEHVASHWCSPDDPI